MVEPESSQSDTVSESKDEISLPPTANGLNEDTKKLSQDEPLKKSKRNLSRMTLPSCQEYRKNGDAPKKGDASEFDTVWICTECKEAECMIQQAEEFLICDGKCNRLFHYPCAGLSTLPDPEVDWFCKDCTRRQHQCSLCQEYGKDDEDVFRCSKDNCGLYFHESCLSMHNVEVTMVKKTRPKNAEESDENSSKKEEGLHDIEEKKVEDPKPMSDRAEIDFSEVSYTPVFTCPAHCCWTCTQSVPQREGEQEAATAKAKKRGKRKSKTPLELAFQCKTETRLFRCLECPRAFHVTCIPPSARFHELAILCHEHSATHKLPDLDLANSLQGYVEDQMDRKTFKVRSKKRRNTASSYNPFFPGMRGDRLLTDEKYLLDYLKEHEEEEDLSDVRFCLPCDLKDEVHSKPPAYKHVHSLRYDPEHRPKKVPSSEERCQCSNSCGEDCYNRMTMAECHGEGKQSNCGVGGENCGNRSLGKRQYAKCKPKREQGKGWGLITVDGVQKGALVQEYMGEVIDEPTKAQRLDEWSKEHPNDPNFYVMALPSGWYIDARHEANLSRFINHSCDPNCKVMTINVKGFMRAAIYSLRDIAPGEFLCYDYHFDTKHGDKFTCRCGATNCRGTMKGGFGQIDDKKKLNWKDAKARYDLDKKFLDEVAFKRETSLVDATVPGAELPNDVVSAGPQGRHRDAAVRNRIFLWRNADCGADFTTRFASLDARATARKEVHESKPKKEAIKVMDIVSVIRG